MFKLFYGIIYLLTLLPLRVLYVFSDMIFPLVYHVVRYRRKVVRKNITNSFPTKNSDEIRKIERDFYHFFCDVFIEAMYRVNMKPDEIKRRISFKNVDLVEAIYAQDKSAFLLMAHYGNWEWVSALSLHLPTESPLYGVYKQLRNPDFDTFTYQLRLKYNMGNVEIKDLVRTLLHRSSSGKKGLYAMLGDQRPLGGKGARFVTEFMHQPTAAVVGTEVLARKFDYPVFVLTITRPRRGYYACEINLITDKPRQEEAYFISKKYFEKLQQDIETNPSLWLWSHNRWKQKISL
ncbi:MAG: hypothetical protein AUK44_07285 [Porphyromonadaceae bacterium CG2_30_38_12]|nr:MAG: hypothetical protein AUK44_07285 [Porphyromonadaceae bacterium CG2_30_38_12]